MEIAVLGDGEVIVVLLQVESVERQVDSWWGGGGVTGRRDVSRNSLGTLGLKCVLGVCLSSYLSRETPPQSRCS